MANNIVDAPQADHDAQTTQHPPDPTLPPAVKRNEDGEGGDNKPNRKNVKREYEKPLHWAKYVEAICGVALVLITFYYTRAAYRQAAASEVAAIATKDAVTVARDTLTATQKANIQQALDNASSAAQNKVVSDKAEAQSAKALQATIDNFHQEQRAWIAPKTATLTARPEIGSPVTFDLTYSNVGKQPAFDVRVSYLVRDIPVTEDIKALIEQGDPCRGKTIGEGQSVIFPGSADEFLKFHLDSPEWPSPLLVSGKSSLLVQMCFTYKTMKTVHQSSGCYIYRKGADFEARMIDCNSGTYAN